MAQRQITSTLQVSKLPLALFTIVVLIALAFVAYPRPSSQNRRVSVAGRESDAQPVLVNLSARDQEVQEILRSLADQANARLVLKSPVKRKISIQAQDSDLSEVMDNLCMALRCTWSFSRAPERALTVNFDA